MNVEFFVHSVINPGNPTGQVLTKEKLRELIEFAYKHRLLVIADEVYQNLVYDRNVEFHSVKKVMVEMGEPYASMELASIHSASKGYFNESGLRAGYVEFFNFDLAILQSLFSVMSLRFVTTSLGQVGLECLLNPPKPGEESHEKWEKEKNAIIEYLNEKSTIFYNEINSIPGLKCNPIQSSLYNFVKIDMPQKAILEAQQKGIEPDFMYTIQLMQSTGVVVLPGAAFGQHPNTYHFRMTILPEKETLKFLFEKLRNFHLDFVSKYK